MAALRCRPVASFGVLRAKLSGQAYAFVEGRHADPSLSLRHRGRQDGGRAFLPERQCRAVASTADANCRHPDADCFPADAERCAKRYQLAPSWRTIGSSRNLPVPSIPLRTTTLSLGEGSDQRSLTARPHRACGRVEGFAFVVLRPKRAASGGRYFQFVGPRRHRSRRGSAMGAVHPHAKAAPLQIE